MTTQSTIFSRVKPQSIRITEKYQYTSTVSRNSEIKPQGAPDGEIEIVIPYRGDICFTDDAINDIEHQYPDVWTDRSNLVARIGYAGFSNYHATDLERKANLRNQNNVLPVEIPVRGQQLNSRDDLVSTQQKCVVTQNYVPHLPSTIPVYIEAKIFDEDFIEEYSLLNPKNLEDLEKVIPDRTDFERRLFFSISVRLSLPTRVENGAPKLTRFEIKWPVTISDHLMKLELFRGLFGEPGNSQISEDKEVTYNPIVDPIVKTTK